MSTDDPLGRRAIAWRRTLGIVAVAGVLVAIIAWLVVRWALPDVLTDQQFRALKLGQTRSAIEHEIGPPTENTKTAQLSSLPAGTTCTYYDATSSSTIPAYFRLCYTNDVLSSKIEYSSIYGPSEQPSVTPGLS